MAFEREEVFLTNKQQLLHMLEEAAFAYQDIQPCIFDTNTTVIDDCDTGVQCYLRQKKSLLTITFRGTDSNTDRKNNLSFWKKVVPYGNIYSKIRVHCGFLNAYKSEKIRHQIQHCITSQIKQVRIAGHSLGAATAILCAIDLQYHFPDRDYEVALFGCPRIGNRAFQKSYNKRIYKTLRVENGNDIVTKVPPVWMGYRHVGIRIPVGMPRLPFIYSISQHRRQEYYKQLWKEMC